jgi:hypothetical protein
MSSNKIFNLILFFIFSSIYSLGICGEISIYDETHVITFNDAGEIYGFYSAHNEKFFCSFFFMSTDKLRAHQDSLITIETFDLNYHKQQFNYSQRDNDSSIKGNLSMKDGQINIRTNTQRPGCDSAAGGLFDTGGLPYTVKTKVSGLGIAVATRKTFLYEGPGLGGKHGYLAAGDAVAILNRKDGYSHIRYFNPDTLIEENDKKKIVTGWIRSVDLVNPFPPSTKH